MTYSAVFDDHLSHPRNPGQLDNANARAELSNPVCGDRLRLSIRIHDGVIEAAQFLAYGCPPTLVCGSVLTELIIGKGVNEALSLTRNEVIEKVGGLPSRKQHAAALAIETLKEALKAEMTNSQD